MDNKNWRPAEGEAKMEDWRTQLSFDSRQKVVNKILETLERRLLEPAPEGLHELRKIAIKFEEKIYSAATNQMDYLRKISVKMMNIDNKPQTTGVTNSLPSNSDCGNKASLDPASHGKQSQVRSQGKPLPIPFANPSQAQQQLLSHSIQNNIASAGVQCSASSSSTLPSGTSLTETTVADVSQSCNMQNLEGNSVGQGVQSNIFANSQGQMQGRQLAQQVVPQQNQQHSQNTQQYIYQQQLQHQILKQKHRGNNQPSIMHSHIHHQQQQEQNLLQPTQLQSSQQPLMQTSSGLPSSQPTLQKAQPSMMQSQPVLRQHQQSQQSMHQQQTQMSQQLMLSSQQKQQLMGQQPDETNIQQNQLLRQPNSVPDMQQQQQQMRLLGQQNNLSNMQQQQLQGQKNDISNFHQQQLVPQSNVFGLQQQQQRLLGNQPGVSNMQPHQHSMQMLQQAKVAVQQQQSQQAPSILLTTQGQQLQSMSQLQSQPAQLQQQLGLQKQPNSLQRDMHQRHQASGAFLQPQNVIEQQKQLFQLQRVHPEASSSSIDSTVQTGHTSVVDVQEEVYQKIKFMKETYLPDLNEIYKRIVVKCQQHDSLAQTTKSEHIDNFNFKTWLERMITFLQMSKINISHGYKEKLDSYEERIINLINSYRPRKPAYSQQQLQPPGGRLPQTQISQLQHHDNQMNPLMQSLNLQSSVTSMQPTAVTSTQHGSMPSLSTHLGVPAVQRNIMKTMQPGSNSESGQGNALSSLQQGAVGSLQQNTVNAPQQANINMLHHQHLKQQQEQKMMQTQQPKQQLQQHRMPHHLTQQQEQQILKQHQQQLYQQRLQQSTQLAAHQMSQLHQINEANDLKLRQGMTVKSGMFHQHHSAHHDQQLKTGPPFPISSPQLQDASPQISQHSSPQIDQQSLLTSLSKAGTPLQSANSPFIAPSPSTPLTPSPMPGDHEKQTSGVSSLPNAGNSGQPQTSVALSQVQSLTIGTPGISASPLLTEFSSPDSTHCTASTIISAKSSATEQPIERLIKVVKSMSPKAFRASVSNIGLAVSMVDMIAGSAPDNGSGASVGEDLVATVKCRLRARNFISEEEMAVTKKMRCHSSAMPLNAVSSDESVNDSLKHINGLETCDLESTATSSIKRPRVEVSHALLEEVREINQHLINTVVAISDDDVDLTAAIAEGCQGTIVKCSFSAVALSPNLKSQNSSAQMSPVLPVRLLVSTNYPNCSPVLLDKLPVNLSNEYKDLLVKAKSWFSTSLRCYSQPMSLGEMASSWDACARAVVVEYAQESGGGSFSSRYGTWENCLSGA